MVYVKNLDNFIVNLHNRIMMVQFEIYLFIFMRLHYLSPHEMMVEWVRIWFNALNMTVQFSFVTSYSCELED